MRCCLTPACDIDRARDDLANDRAWKAHDRLEGLIGQGYDREIVSLLAETRHAMRRLSCSWRTRSSAS